MSTEQTEQSRFLEDLTDAQRKAVLHTEGPLLVLAAAGSGKTRVITRRIAHLIDCGVPPWSILALTFTNKAAGEMRQRVESLLEGESGALRGLTVTTFHSLCARLLRRYADEADLGIKGDFSIYDSSDQTALMKRVIEEMGYSTQNWPPRSVLSAIGNAKNELLDAKAYSEQAGDFVARTRAKIFEAYEAALRKAGAVDFDDLLLLTASMLKRHKSIADECRQRWQYLLIDEYQDTNHAQFLIASLLSGETAATERLEGGDAELTAAPNICVVGDPDQAIYGWRGADVRNILDFETQYPGARVITLGQNFRSTPNILAAADQLIRHNTRRKHKELTPSIGVGDPVSIVHCRDEHHESELVLDWLSRMRDENNLAWKDMAIFYRTNALSRVTEDTLRRGGVPYVIARGTAFYEREEIKNVLSYLRVVANPSDEVSLRRIVNKPTRGIGKTSLTRLEAWAAATGLTLMQGMQAVAAGRAAEVDGLSTRAVSSLKRFISMLRGWGVGEGSDVPSSLTDLVERVVRESGLEKMYADQAEKSAAEADSERLENINELISSAAEFEQDYDPSSDPQWEMPGREGQAASVEPVDVPVSSLLRAYLESVALVADADAVDPRQGAVMLMTLHAAKGLEFPAVAMIGLEEGLLPHSRSHETPGADEEERRLCFVGMTRAMRHLHVTSARYRTNRGIPERTIRSRFLEEMTTTDAVVSDQTDDGFEGADWPEVSWEPPAGMSNRRGKEASSGLSIGVVVRHPRFGVGTITWLQGGSNARAKIKFRDVGEKTLVLEYAKLERIG